MQLFKLGTTHKRCLKMENESNQEQIEQQTTVTYEDLNGKPKRRRTVAGKAPAGVVDDDKPKASPKRATLLKGKDIEEMFELASSTAVMLGAPDFWLIQGAEVRQFSDPMADLLNRIPARYAAGFVDMSGYLVVAVGLYSVFKVRWDMQKQLNAMNKNGKVEQQELVFN